MLLSEDCPLSFTGMKQISEENEKEITVNGPVLYGAGRNDFDAGKSLTRVIGF
jgi:hypothetical protein